ncbi:hypothetical protein CVT26_014941 [Gymnopilus dilepis]|uniref:Uncharacterized protein n=1 Tax=Gymnopilus dilepis TaxID=231916 RepID=A0A409XWV7_9AGAR|nr:hypothetical protein CVT26_014941 [Gymnopilus dilepis]
MASEALREHPNLKPRNPEIIKPPPVPKEKPFHRKPLPPLPASRLGDTKPRAIVRVKLYPQAPPIPTGPKRLHKSLPPLPPETQVEITSIIFRVTSNFN